MSGLGCDWYSAFKWFSRRYSQRSGRVLRGMGLTVVLSASTERLRLSHSQAATQFLRKLAAGEATFFMSHYGPLLSK